MQKRHTLHGAAPRLTTKRPGPSASAAESGTRLRSAQPSTPSLEENIQASIEFAMAELDALEVPYTASAPPLAVEPAQQMPRGMPPLPFHAPHPVNMPPLPQLPRAVVPTAPPSLADAAAPSALELLTPAISPENEVDASPRPSRWLLFVALVLGITCLALAFWLKAY